MDAQHGGRALDSYLEDPGSILLPSFQRVFPLRWCFFQLVLLLPLLQRAAGLVAGLQENGVAQDSMEERERRPEGPKDHGPNTSEK